MNIIDDKLEKDIERLSKSPSQLAFFNEFKERADHLFQATEINRKDCPQLCRLLQGQAGTGKTF